MTTESVSDKAVDCLSDQDDEILVEDVHNEIKHIFGCAVKPNSQVPIKNLLKKVYKVIRHPRQRPALKDLLRQSVHNEKPFQEAWSSLLYLTRIFYAAVTFVDFATRVSFTSLKLEQVPAVVACQPKPSGERNPTTVLESLGYSHLNSMWSDFFKTAKRAEDFTQLSRLKKTVHGEVQLISYVEMNMYACQTTDCKVFPYMGCSKKCCFFCEMFRKTHGMFQARGTHETLFPLWALPQTLSKQSLQLLHHFSSLLKNILQGLLIMPQLPQRRDLLQQSSAALSTVQAVQRTEPVYSTKPQVLRFVHLIILQPNDIETKIL
jgi:hypothetical protein